jgi:hypothetical protein
MQAQNVDSFAERAEVLQAESERIKQYLRALPTETLSRQSACSQWQVQDMIALLIGVAETHTSSVSRGLAGDTSPPPGPPSPWPGPSALSAEGIAPRSSAARQAGAAGAVPT